MFLKMRVLRKLTLSYLPRLTRLAGINKKPTHSDKLFSMAEREGFALAFSQPLICHRQLKGFGTGSATGTPVRTPSQTRQYGLPFQADRIILAEREGFEPSQGLAPL